MSLQIHCCNIFTDIMSDAAACLAEKASPFGSSEGTFFGWVFFTAVMNSVHCKQKTLLELIQLYIRYNNYH